MPSIRQDKDSDSPVIMTDRAAMPDVALQRYSWRCQTNFLSRILSAQMKLHKHAEHSITAQDVQNPLHAFKLPLQARLALHGTSLFDSPPTPQLSVVVKLCACRETGKTQFVCISVK